MKAHRTRALGGNPVPRTLNDHRVALTSSLLASIIVLTQMARAAAFAAESSSLLTNVQQIIALGTNASARSYDGRFQGVVIYVSPPTRRLYVQEGDQGLQVNLVAPVTGFHIGQAVEVEGNVADGLPLPRIVGARAKVLGEASIPEAKLSSAARLAAGQDAFRFVTARGVVRDMTTDRGVLTLLLAEENRIFELAVQVSGLPPLPHEWLDAEIEAQGIAYPFYNARNQPTNFRFHVSSLNFVRVIKPGVGTLFDRPVMSIAEASRQPWEWQRRLRIVGTVTAHQPLEFLYVDDGTGPMQANLMPPLPKVEGGHALEHDAQVWLQPGDRVEIIGVRHNWSSLTPTLIQAEFRRIGRSPLVVPQPVTIADLEAGRFAGRLVSIAARLLDQRLWVTGNLNHQILVLQAGDHTFQATWESETPADWDLEPGSYVRVTGVNDAMQGRFKGACIYHLLLRSTADVVPAAEPPFWTLKEYQRIALVVGVLTALAGAWILMQRWQMRRLEHRVATRTADLRATNERLQEEVAARQRAEAEVQRALAEEKELSELKSRFVSMVSHEFRTPLGIIMSSAEILDAYLDRLPPEERRSNLSDIAQASRHMASMIEEVLLLSRVEAGKMTFRPAALGLTELCQKLVDEVRSSTSGRCPIAFYTTPGLPPAQADEALLRHIFTNLLSNAVKYSPVGSPVAFTLEVRDHAAVFTVRDHGIGVPEVDARQLFQAFHRGRNVADVPGTGLGLVIVKRCVELHQGKIDFASKEGQGTTFTVTLPVFGVSPPADRSEAPPSNGTEVDKVGTLNAIS
jgi:signal transduction histidine kinase